VKYYQVTLSSFVCYYSPVCFIPEPQTDTVPLKLPLPPQTVACYCHQRQTLSIIDNHLIPAKTSTTHQWSLSQGTSTAVATTTSTANIRECWCWWDHHPMETVST